MTGFGIVEMRCVFSGDSIPLHYTEWLQMGGA